MQENDTPSIESTIARLGLDLSNPPKPGGSYVAVNIRGNIAYVAIQLPIRDGQFLYTGKFGENLTTQDGYEAAKIAATNVLKQIHAFVGFDRLLGLNHADIYYRATEEWDEAPAVANGASDLFLAVLGDLGKHSRSIFGVEKLPRGFSVGLATSFTLK